MPREELALYLTLSAEFGGRRFGPFEGLEVRLGTDRERCHIVLAENLGVAQDHCKVLRQGPDSLILTPSERTAAVWLWKSQALRPAQVHTPTAVRPGDSFALVTQDGPRFVIELAPLPDDIKAARSTTGKRSRRNLTPAKLVAEIWRIFLARLYTFSPVSMAARAWYFVESGAIWQPRILITSALFLMTMLGNCGQGCALLQSKWANTKLIDEKAALQSRVDTCDAMKGKGIENYRFEDLASQILDDSSAMTQVLTDDSAFAASVKQAAKDINTQSKARYDWLYKNGAAVSSFQAWRIRMEKEGQGSLDPTTARLLTFAAAVPGRSHPNLSVGIGADGEYACLSGPLQLTTRQAISLGLETQPDSFRANATDELSSDPVKRLESLQAVAANLGMLPLPQDTPTVVDQINEGVRACLRTDLPDQRTTDADVLKMIRTQFGIKATGLASTALPVGAVARVAKLYASDLFPDVRYVGEPLTPIFFTQSPLGAGLSGRPHADAPMRQAAEVVARAIVLPCRAALDPRAKDLQKVFGDKLPDPIPCLVLNYRLNSDG